MYKCDFCNFYSEDLEDFEVDYQFHKGYWCPWCDGFTYFKEARSNSHHFSVIFEKKALINSENPIKVNFHTHTSPLRWPGGKSKFIGPILSRCRSENMVNFVEPFAGGASVGLSLLLAGKIEELFLNDLDYGVYSLFQVIKDCPWMLIDKIEKFVPSKEAYKKAQKMLKNKYKELDMLEAAWNLLIVNRLAFSGIAKANCMSNPAARWNADTLKRRIMNIHSHSKHLHVSCMDACDFIEEMYWKPNTTLFIDPPYKSAGEKLYMEYYKEDDHERLAFLLDELYKGMPGADMLLTYDDSDFIKSLYRFPIIEEIGRIYSISN